MAHRRMKGEGNCSDPDADKASIRGQDSNDAPPSHWIPAVDICETDRLYILTAELPGVARGDLQISAAGSELSIKGERRFDPFCPNETCHRMETVRGPFHRAFTLPENLDGSEVSARLDDGVLEVRIGKSPKARRIPVKDAHTSQKR